MRALLLAGVLVLAVPAGAAPPATSVKDNWHVLDDYCVKCHNATDWAGGVAFDTMTPEALAADAEVWEKAVRKVRGTMMPPPGKPQPDPAARQSLVVALERDLDQAAAAHPNPGSVGLHRLNRTEYANAIAQILDVKIDAAALLPRDDKADGFDNVADVLKVSPSFLEQYLSAARQVSTEAVGDSQVRARSSIYHGSADARGYVHREGLPLGTWGGVLIEHDFPADADYEFSINGLVGAGYVWGVLDSNSLIITVDDVKVFEERLGGDEDLAAVEVEQATAVTRINGRFQNIRRHVAAGPHRIGIAFRQKSGAVGDDVLHSLVPVEGMTSAVNGNSPSPGPRVQSVEIKGPISPSGPGDTPSRRKVFVCRPQSAADELPCAHRIFAHIAEQAFRRPVTDADLAGALEFYADGRRAGGFDTGIRKGLMAILVSPKFLYRAHEPPAGLAVGAEYRLGDADLASRLAFFLWSRPPDEELIRLGAGGELHQPAVLEQQVRRLLADPRAHALVTNFAFQWLNVHGLQLVNPDPNLFPDYTPDLIGDFERELELFIGSVFEGDRSLTELLSADYTFLNERLALHYGIRSVRGDRFQRVTLQESARRGLLGKGAVLMVTSYANRTTPVLRGAYILDKFLGTPPEAPPPGVPGFVESQDGGKALTVRARLESHRNNPSCSACHGIIDPLGLALENYNAVGQWRDKDIDANTAIDSTGKLMDGTPLRSVDDLRNALLARKQQFIQTFTENLLTFGLGRTLSYYDMPTVRSIVRKAATEDYRLSSIILSIVKSDAFQMEKARDDKPRAADQKVAALH